MIRFSCTNCGAAFKVKDEHAGKRVKCPKCSTVNTVPDASAEEADEEEAAPVAAKAAPVSAASRRKRGKASRSGGGGRRAHKTEGTPKWMAPVIILAVVVGAVIVALQYMGGPDYGKMLRDADDMLTENRAADAVALLEQIPVDDTSFSQKVQEKLVQAKQLVEAKEDRTTERLGTNIYGVIQTLDKRIKDMGNTHPDYAPTTRYLLKRAREFEQDFPEHEKVEEVRGMHGYYRNVASLDNPPTEADVRIEINYRAFANRFDQALDAVDEFARDGGGSAELVDALRGEVRTRAYTDWAADKEQAQQMIQDGEHGRAETNLRKLVEGYKPYSEISTEIQDLIVRAESKGS